MDAGLTRRAGPRPGPWVAVAVALALGLRLWHLRAGLPEFLDEAIPFRYALAMWDGATGRVDWNPHFLQYPSLTLYLNLLLQRAHLALGTWLGWFRGPADYTLAFAVDPTPMVLAARLLAVA